MFLREEGENKMLKAKMPEVKEKRLKILVYGPAGVGKTVGVCQFPQSYIIVTSHQKDVYGTAFNKIGVTYDSMKGDDYLFDLVFRVERKNGDLIAYKVKERAELGKEKFPAEFVWSYVNFCKFYGKQIIEKEVIPVKMATKEQIERVNKLIGKIGRAHV